MQKIVLFLFLTMLVGCCSSPADKEITEFRHKHPQEFKNYTHLYATSTVACRDIVEEQDAFVTDVLERTEERYGDAKGLTDFVDGEIRGEHMNDTNYISMLDTFDALSTNGATVFYYDWTNGKWYESGFLALKNGEILKRY